MVAEICSDISVNGGNILSKGHHEYETHNAMIIFEAPIRQSSPIKELDRLISRQVEYTKECDDVTLNQ